MTAEQITHFLTALRAKQIRVKDNGWIEACCPLAPFTHQHGVDHTPSFGVKIVDGGESHFFCFSCRGGSAQDLINTLEFYSQKMGAAEAYDFKSARLLLVNEKVILPKEYMVEGEDTVVQLFDEWPAYWPSTFESPHQYPQAYAYLQARRVSDKTIEKQGLRYDPAKQMIVAPYWNVYGKLAGARGRSIDPNCPKEYRHHLYKYNGKHNCTLCWYNEMALNLPGPVVVVEGQFDCWRVEEGFPKVVANLTAKPSREKLKKLGDSDLVIQIPDNDQAGEASVQTYAKACSAIGVEHRVLRLPEGLKDADECHSEWLRDKIEELL